MTTPNSTPATAPSPTTPPTLRQILSQLTPRSVITGFVLSIVLCGVNSYLTLKAGVIEEGPIISALIFIALFGALKQRVSTTEAVFVATMGSAGGSFGFLANLFTAYHMVGIHLETWQMIAFAFSTGAISILMAIPFYQLFIVKEELAWPVGQACANVIKTTVSSDDTRQGKVILGFSLAFFAILLLQGRGWAPEDLPLFVVGAAGVGIALSPFLISAGYLVGIRVGAGFVTASVVLLIIAKYTDKPAAPHRFFWPGVAFLIASGITSLALKWRTTVDAIRSLKNLGSSNDEDAILSGKWLIILLAVFAVIVVLVMNIGFGIALYLGTILVLVGPTLLNLIATRAMGETTFNPIRVMGILLQGVTALLGGNTLGVNLTGAGVVAGGSNQTAILDQDLYTGRKLGVRPRVQVLLQAIVLPFIAVVSVLVFQLIARTNDLSIDSDKLNAPVAKAWAGFVLLLAGGKLPPNAINMMIFAGIAGIVLALLDTTPLRKYLPHPTGIGIGLILAIPYSVAFFVGALLFWAIGKYLKVSESTLNSVAAAGILGEGLGGIISGALKAMGIFPM